MSALQLLSHDGFFKASLQNPVVATALFKSCLPEDLKACVDFKSLKKVPITHLSKHLSETRSDMLFAARISGRANYIYTLFEHKSSFVPDTLLQVMEYRLSIMRSYAKPGKLRYPLVYPLIIYHGKSRYTGTEDLAHRIDADKSLVEKYFTYKANIIDLGRIPDEQLWQHNAAGVMEYALKHIFDRPFLPCFKALIKPLQQLEQLGYSHYVIQVINYVLSRGVENDFHAYQRLINDNFSQSVGDKTMTMAEALRKEGLEKGLAEGERKGRLEELRRIVMNLLHMEKDLNYIQNLTGLNQSEILSIKQQNARPIPLQNTK